MKTKFFTIAFIIVMAFALTFAFAEKRAFTIADYYKIKRVGDLDLADLVHLWLWLCGFPMVHSR